jgi:hypothetical protein
MKKPPITEFEPVELARLQPFLDCMGPLDPGGDRPDWWFGMFSTRTVVYGSGRIARSGEGVVHKVDPDELARCRSIAAKAESVRGWFLESDGEATWHRFFVAANVDTPVPERIDEALIRERFGGTILPVVAIGIQPLDETSASWSQMIKDLKRDAEQEAKDRGLQWKAWLERATTLARSLADSGPRPKKKDGDKAEAETKTVRTIRHRLTVARLFQGKAFRDSAYVEIGNYFTDKEVPPSRWTPGLESWPSQYPRLIVGLTQGGSLAGLITYVVNT